MPIQKLLPTSRDVLGYSGLGSYNSIYSISNTFAGASGRYDHMLFSGGYGIVAKASTSYPTSYLDVNVPYLRKSISNPDDSTYLGVGVVTGVAPDYSGLFLPNQNIISSTFGDIYSMFDRPSIEIDNVYLTMRYSGHPFDSVLTCDYKLFDYDFGTLIDIGQSTISSPVLDTMGGFQNINFAVADLDSVYNYNGRLQSGGFLAVRVSMFFSGITDPSAYTGSSYPFAISSMELTTSGAFRDRSVNMHMYSAPVQQSGGLELYTKRHGYINSIEELIISGIYKSYPTNGTYANGSGALFELFPSDYTTYRTATGYNAGATGLISPAFSGDNPMVNYIRESTDAPNNTSYIGLTNYVTSLTGHSNNLNLAIGTRLDNLTTTPRSLKTNMTWSGVPNLAAANISNMKSEYFMTLGDSVYRIGYSSYPVGQIINNTGFSFTKVSFPELFLDGSAQPNLDNIVYISGALLENLISSGAAFSTYTTAVLKNNTTFGIKNHGISAFDVDASGTYIEYIPHPAFHTISTVESSSGLPLSTPNVSIRNSGNFTMFMKANVLELDFPMNIEGTWPSGILNLYLANNLAWTQNNKNLTFYIDNHSGTAVNNSVNMHIGSRYSDSGILNMYMPVPLIGSINNLNNPVNFHTKGLDDFNHYLNLYTVAPLVGYDSGSVNMFTGGGGINKEYSFSIALPSDYGSGNNSVSLLLENRNVTTGTINLYTGGTGYGTASGGINLMIPVNTPIGSVPLLVYNNLEYDSGNVSLHTTSYVVDSGSINMYIPVIDYGYHSGDISVYLKAEAPFNVLDFYLKQETAYQNKDVTLFMPAYLVDSGTIPLYVNGGGIALNSGGLEMFVRSAIQKSGDVKMSIMGNLAFGNIDFTIYSKDVDRLNSKTNFFVNSADKSGLMNSFDVYVKSVNYTADVPFYMPTSSTGNTSGELAFYMLNDTTLNKDVLLCIYNNLESKEAGYTLFTQGDGLTYGGSVANSSMNLFINRGNESVDASVQMIVNGPSGETNNVPFYLNGGYITESGISLTMPNIVGPNSGVVEMYTHGF